LGDVWVTASRGDTATHAARVEREQVEVFTEESKESGAGVLEELDAAGWRRQSAGVCRGREGVVPPGPPGLKRIVLLPLAEAFVANNLIKGTENVLEDDALK
jgi:hypothetical protein